MTTTLRTATLAALASALACSDNEFHKLDGDNISGPAISADPGQLDFGAVGLSDGATRAVSVHSIGTAALQIGDLRVDGPDSFTVSWPDPVDSLPPGQATELLVSYDPVAVGEGARLVVASNDPGQPELPIPLTGSAAYGLLSIQPDPVDFGGMSVGDTLVQTAQLVNQGDDEISVSSLQVLGEGFSILDAPITPFTVAVDGQQPVDLQFTALADGAYTGQLYATSTSPDGQTSAELLAGVGVGNITGRICGPDGEEWVVGARVYVSGDAASGGSWMVEDFTDADGHFFLEGVPSGNHSVHVEKGSWTTTIAVSLSGGTYELPEPECLDPDSARVAVVTGQYDSIGHLLGRLDIDYDAWNGRGSEYLDLLRNPDEMARYDIIFFNCGMSFGWLNWEEEIAENLREFVADGGSVYASDWAYGLVEAAWPTALDLVGDDELWSPEAGTGSTLEPFLGYTGSYTGDVLDSTMRSAIGASTAEIVYDLDGWVLIDAVGSESAVLVEGDVEVWDSTYSSTDRRQDVPLVVRLDPGGTVIYTTFHNEYQLTNDMEAALEEIILSL